MPNKKIAILAWVYHLDLMEEIVSFLKPIKNHIKIFAGFCYDNDNSSAIHTLKSIDENCVITQHKNAGCDVLPFLYQLKNLDLVEHEFFIKIHSKKSGLGTLSHINWRHILFNSLLGGEDRLISNLQTMISDQSAYLCPRPLMCRNQEGYHKTKIKFLQNLLGLPSISAKKKNFCAGNMFMGHSQTFKENLDLHYDQLHNLLSQETGKVDEKNEGTYSHAMERIFGYINYQKRHKLSYVKYDSTIKIVNRDIKSKKKLHMVKMDNNEVFIYEQPNIYGKILDIRDSGFSIKWLHHSNQPICAYKKICHKTYMRNNNT